MKNSVMWNNYSHFALHRGNLVFQILKQYRDVLNKQVLDIGCGDGGTAYVLAREGAVVTAIDIKENLRFKHGSISYYKMSATEINFPAARFDIIILQDVIEHLPDINRLFSEVRRLLKNNGIFYLTTPNKLSPLNFIADPHWGLPFISILPRKEVEFFIKHVFRRDRRNRNDWAALFSLFRLKKVFTRYQFDFKFHNSLVARTLFENPAAVICSPLHLKMISLLKKLHAEKIFQHIVNDKRGLFNYFINPTWYIVGWHNHK